METSKTTLTEKIGFTLVLLMTLMQAFFALYAYIDPASFAALRGTEIFDQNDMDWIKIYGSRTLFISLSVGYLLYMRNYRILMWLALIGIVMPVTDAFLAYQAQAADKVIVKHVLTAIYLAATFVVLHKVVNQKA